MRWRTCVLAGLLWLPCAGGEGPPEAREIGEAGLRQLIAIRRVYVDRLTGGETAAQMREILISALENAKLFVLTENQEKAEATLRGAAEDLVFTESHSSSEGLNVHANAGTSRSTNQRGAYAGTSFGENESSRSTERR